MGNWNTPKWGVPAPIIPNSVNGGPASTDASSGGPMPFGGNDPFGSGNDLAPLNIQALRTMLAKAGYNIPTQGAKAGSLFKAALRDWLQPSPSHPVGNRILALIGADKAGGPIASGLRNPKAFNMRYGLLPGGTVPAPVKKPATRLNANGTPTAADTAATFPSTGSQAPTVDLSGMDALMKGLGLTNSPMIDTGLANQMVGGDDAAINDILLKQKQGGANAKQSMADIKNWYGQVAAARANAASADSAMTGAGQQSMKDMVSGIVSSLGGDANMGSGEVAGSGADTTGMLAALGANEDQYNNDLKPLLAAESAGQMSRQAAINQQTSQDLEQQLMDAHTKRGADKAAALLQIMGMNQDRRTANNANAQTRFGDQLAIQNANEAAQLDGAKVINYLSKPTAPVKGTFGYSSTKDRSTYANALAGQIAPNGKLAQGMTRAKAMAVAQRLAHIYFPKGGIPNGTGLISGVLGTYGL